MPAAPQAEFSGLWILLVTPFRRGEIDHRGLAALTCSLSSTGIQGFVVCGSTGEAASLDDEELANGVDHRLWDRHRSVTY